MRAALFVTCLGDRFFADAVSDAARLLRRLGVDVDVPRGQTCCGQPAWNAGYAADARAAARHVLRVLGGHERVVTPSGSCAAMLRRVYPRLMEGEALEAEARALAGRTFELSEFVSGTLGVERLGDGLTGRRVAYHHGCHALRELGLGHEALRLLTSAGATVVDWPAAEECCGFGGTFSVKLPHVSAGMADRKLDTLPEADVLTSADPGCLMQLGTRATRRGLPVPVRHLATVLLEAANGPA